MNFEQEQICRLCLKVAKNYYKKIDEVMKQVFDILLLKLDLNIFKDPIICQDCVEGARRCLKFKYTFIHTEVIILSYSTSKEKAKHDIKVIYKEREHVQTFEEDLHICRICMERDRFVSLNALMSQDMIEMLSKCMPEIDFNIIEDSIICAACRANLQGHFKFALNCLDIEEKIKTYCRKEGTDNTGQVNLDSLLHFLSKYHIKYPQKYAIKEELNTLEATETVYFESSNDLIKMEQLDFKEQEHINNTNADVLIQKDSLDLQDRLSARKDVSDTRTYMCSLCGHKSKQKSNLKSHMLVHKDVSKIKMNKCSLCAYQTKHKSNLKLHMLVHKDISEIKTYKCSSCAYETKHKGSLKTHLLVHKDVSEIEMQRCSLCAYEAKYKSSLNRHMLLHNDSSKMKMYKCSFCDYEGSQKSNLKKHMWVHRDIIEIKTYKCSFCTYEAKRKTHLKRHEQAHKYMLEIKTYKCPLCEYESKQKGSFQAHMLIHKDSSGMNMYKCSSCAYETKLLGHLRRHTLIHKNTSEVKMYKCSLCSYEAKQQQYITRHMLVHMDSYGEICMYKCTFCAYETKHQNVIKKHVDSYGQFRNNNEQVFILFL